MDTERAHHMHAIPAAASNSHPKLSIVVPCYKTERYLARCLDSLLAQTLRDIEIICVIDGSPDNCLSIACDYERRHPDTVRVINRDNGGLWNARWSGTDASHGEYVAYVDSDDYVEPNFAASLYETGKREKADIVVCGFRRIEEETGDVLSTEMDQRRPPFIPGTDPGRLIGINPAAWNKAFSRNLLMRMRRLAEPPSILEDVTLSQLAYLSARGSVAFTGSAPYNYLIRRGSMINSVTTDQVDSVKRALLEVRKHFVSEGATEGLLEELDATTFLHLGVSMSFRLSCNPEVDLRRALSDTTTYLGEHFPTWKRSPYINLAYARAHGPAYIKLLIAQLFYRAHLMGPFLAAYRFVLKRTGKEIKW